MTAPFPPPLQQVKIDLPITTAKLTSKGQITIPAKVQQDLKVNAGDRAEFIKIAPSRYEIVAAELSITEIKGMFDKPTQTVSIPVINNALTPNK
jgi:antitoxin PrlF